MVTAVVGTTTTAGSRGVATLIGTAMTVGTKQGIPPLKEGMVTGIGVTTEKEVFYYIFTHMSVVKCTCVNVCFPPFSTFFCLH